MNENDQASQELFQEAGHHARDTSPSHLLSYREEAVRSRNTTRSRGWFGISQLEISQAR